MSTHRRGWKRAGKWLFGILFVVAGANHFRSPDMYMKIMPPYLPLHRPLVLISGVFEMALGALLLIPQVSWLAAWGLIALLHRRVSGEHLPLPAPGDFAWPAPRPSVATAVARGLDLVGVALHKAGAKTRTDARSGGRGLHSLGRR